MPTSLAGSNYSVTLPETDKGANSSGASIYFLPLFDDTTIRLEIIENAATSGHFFTLGVSYFFRSKNHSFHKISQKLDSIIRHNIV